MKKNHINRLSLSGLAATLVGNGIGRFAYIALLPIIVQQMWFNYKEASYIGVATLFGYLIGAPISNYLSKIIPIQVLLRISMLACALSYFACAWQPGGFYWFIAWRATAGICGAILMVLAPFAVLSQCEIKQRGRFAGVVFSGVGIGIMASGTLVPLLLLFGLVETWVVLGVICLLLTFFTWNQWSSKFAAHNTVSNSTVPIKEPYPKNTIFPLALLLIAYALNAVGYLPHTLFWVDYIVRELNMSISVGGFFWATFGVGAAFGPFITGPLSDRFGFPKALLLGFSLKSAGVALPLLSNSPASLFFSSLLVGIFTPGIATIVSAYSMEIAGISHHKQVWGWMTFSFAFAQAIIGYLMAFIMVGQASYRILFVMSSLALVFSSICIILLMIIRNIVSTTIQEAVIIAKEE